MKKIKEDEEEEIEIPDRKKKLKKNLIIQNEEKEEDINTNIKEEQDELENISKGFDDFIKDEKKEVKEEKIKDLYDNLTIMNIIIKAAFSNIDKITLIVLYFVSVYSINIVHFILVAIFMFQLLFPKFMFKYSIILIAFCQIIFLVEYLVDLFKNKDYSEFKINLIKLFIPFDIENTEIDFLLYLLTYCYYAQNQLFF